MQLYEKIEALIKEKKWIDLSSLLNTDLLTCIKHAQKKGWLRVSKYDYDTKEILPIFCCFLNMATTYNLGQIEETIKKSNIPFKEYFLSFLYLYSIADEARQAFLYIKNRPSEIDYSLLVFANSSFANPCSKTAIYGDDLSCIIASSHSFNAKVFRNKPKITKDLFSKASSLNFYRNLEILIDCFKVTLKREDDECRNKFVLMDNENFLFSLKWGWRKFFLQQIAQESNLKNNVETTTEVFQHFSNKHNLISLVKEQDGFFIIKGKWSSNISLRKALEEFISLIVFPNSLFYGNEYQIIATALSELHIPENIITQKIFRNKYSILDILHLTRLFSLLSVLANNHFVHQNFFCFKINRKKFDLFVKKHLGEQCLEILHDCTLTEFNSHIDIQYTSIAISNDEYIIPTEILIRNNIVRNLMSKLGNKARIDGSGRIDLIHEKYKKILTKMKIPHCGGVKYEGSDLDTIFQIEHTIFISENKNMLFPTSFYEARNVVFHYEKSKSQRDHFLKLFQEKKETLFKEMDSLKKYGIDFRKAKDVVFYLTFGNREPTQMNSENFPVVYIGEITAFLENAPIKIHYLSSPKDAIINKVKWRDTDKPTENDVKQYLKWNKQFPDIAKIRTSRKLFKSSFIYDDAQIIVTKNTESFKT